MQVSNEFMEQVVFKDYLDDHESKAHAQKLQHVSAFTQDALQIIHHGETAYGDTMPWLKTQDKIRFRPEEVTIWAGTNGSGKSLVMGQVALHLSQFTTTGIASFEMPPKQTVARMLRQACSHIPSDMIVDRFNQVMDMHIYNHVGSLDPNTVYGMCHYMAKEKGIKHIMIDSLVKCGINMEKNEPQKQFMSKIQDIAKEHKIHIHVVMHTRKSERETDIPDKYSVKGAGELVDLTDNLLIIYRNKKKEKQRDEALRNNVPFEDDTADCFIRVAKQRHGNFEKTLGFWWHENSQQWIDNTDGIYHRYVK